MTDRTLLFVSYLFPPTGGAGVQRALKFVKYLPLQGWHPTVLTVRQISAYVYDHSLLEEVPGGVDVVRTESLDPLRLSARLFAVRRPATVADGAVRHHRFKIDSRLTRIYRSVRDLMMLPDAQLGWIPFAFRTGRAEIRSRRPSVILATSGPFSSAIIAYLLGKRTGIPYVLDFRDGWTDDPYLHVPTRLHRALHRRLESLILKKAAAIVVYGTWLADRFRDRYPEVSGRIHVIPNGYDPADLEGVVAAKTTQERFRLVHTGTLYKARRDNFLTFLAALQTLTEVERERLEVLVVGQVYESAQSDVDASGLDDVVTFIGYVSHAEALSYVVSAGGLLLFLPTGDVSSLSGKVFEYMMARRPIIACVEPGGGCASVLQEAGYATAVVSPADPNAIAASISALLAGCHDPVPHVDQVDRFSRVRQARQLADVLDGVACDAQSAWPAHGR